MRKPVLVSSQWPIHLKKLETTTLIITTRGTIVKSRKNLLSACKAEQTSKDCIKDWASSKESLWYDYRCVSTEEVYATENDYAAEDATEETAEAYEYYDDYDEGEPIKRSEGRFLLSDTEACYAVYHLVSNNLVDNSDHRQDLEDYILEEYAYEENFMRFLGNHVGIYISEYDYERYEREQTEVVMMSMKIITLNNEEKMNAMKILHHTKAYSLVITVVGLFLFRHVLRIRVELQKVKKRQMMLFALVRRAMPRQKVMHILMQQTILIISIKS